MGRFLAGGFADIAGQTGFAGDELQTLGLTKPADIRRVGKALIELADALLLLGDDASHDTAGSPVAAKDDVDLAIAANALRLLRQRRNRHFVADLFADPAWDMLLVLFVSTVRGDRVSTKSLCAGAGVPASTALRWLNILETRGLIRRWTPPDDHRLTLVQMTSDCYDRMRRSLADGVGAFRTDPLKLRKTII